MAVVEFHVAQLDWLAVRELLADDRAILHADDTVSQLAHSGVVGDEDDREAALLIEGCAGDP